MASGPLVGTQKSLLLVGDDDDDGDGGTASPTVSTTVSTPASHAAQPAQDGPPFSPANREGAVGRLTAPVRPPHWRARGRSRFQGSALNIAVPQSLPSDGPMDMMAEDLSGQGASALWKPPLRFPPAGDGLEADLSCGQESPLHSSDKSSDTSFDALDDASPPPMPYRPGRWSTPRPPGLNMPGRAVRQDGVSATTTASATIEPYSLDTPRAAPRLSGDGGYKVCILPLLSCSIFPSPLATSVRLSTGLRLPSTPCS